MLRFNSHTGDYFLVTQDVQAAEDAGLTLSTSVRGPKGEPIYFTKEPYAVLKFVDQGDDEVKGQLKHLIADYKESWSQDAAIVIPRGIIAQQKDWDFLPFQRGGIAYAMKRQHTLIADEMGLGKQSSVDTPVLTPAGWRKIGGLVVGDEVYGRDGRPHRVLGIFPQGVKPSYRVTFRDGTSTNCGIEHLWAVKDGNMQTRGKPWAVKTLGEIIERGVKLKSGANKWFIPVMEPAQFLEKSYAIDPYVLGVLIGDDSLTGSTVSFSNPDFDSDIRGRVARRLPVGLRLSGDRSSSCPRFYVASDTYKFNPLTRELVRLGLNVLSGHKFIPEEYKWGSVKQRLDLLRGLMDTDGSAKNNRITFHTTSERLARDVADLTRSLGGVAIERWYDRSSEGKPRECQVNVRLATCPFYTSRKSQHWSKSERFALSRYIESVEYDGEAEQVCIAVDASDSLYVVENFIVTHNTIQAIGYANTIGAERILVICPASIRIGWKRQIETWSTIPRLRSRAMLNSRSGAGLNPDLNYLITSYELAANEVIHDALCAGRWDLIILDEAHYLKTGGARRTQAVFGGGRKFKGAALAERAEHLMPLTGTPLPNRPRECWTIAKALLHESIDFRNFEQFCYRFNPSARGITDTGRVFNREEKGRLNELQARLRCNFMVRRLKKDVLKDLPDVRYEIAYMEEDGRIKDIIRRERMLDFKVDDLKNPFAEIWGQISTIRRELGEALLPQFVRHTKMILDIMEVPKLPVFFHHRGVMDAFRDEMKDYGVVEVRGGVSPENKQKAVDEFVANPKVRVFSGQLQASGFGIDGLQQVASMLCIFEPDWVPGNNEQIVARLHRHGQHDNVLAQMMAVEGSLLDRILGTAIDKMHGIHQSLDEREAIEAAAIQNAADVAKMLEIMQ